MRYSKFVFAISLLACSPSEPPKTLYELNDVGVELRQCWFPVNWAISINVPEKFHWDIYQAFKYWDDQTPKDLFAYRGVVERWSDSRDHGRLIVVGYPYDVPNPTGTTLASVYREGRTDGCLRRGAMYLYTDLHKHSRPSLERLFRHEIGHLLGFKHMSDPKAIMFISVSFTESNSTPATDFELRQFRLFY